MSPPLCLEKREMAKAPNNVMWDLDSQKNVFEVVDPGMRRDSQNETPSSSERTDSFSSTPTALLTPLPLVTDSKLHLLWPQPQEMLQTEGPGFRIGDGPLSVVLDAEEDPAALHSLLEVWDVHLENFTSVGVECVVEDVCHSESAHILCRLCPRSSATAESYKLIVTDQWIRILFPDVIGLHHALCTLGQLYSLYKEDGEIHVPALYIHDWPQLRHRGVLLDFSSTARKPDLETLKGYVKVMSFLKMRQLHCFFVLQSGLSFLNRSLLELSRHCRRYLVDVVPVVDSNSEANTEDVGHLLRDLVALFSAKEVQVGPNMSSQILASEAILSHFPVLLPKCRIFLSSNSSMECLPILPLNYAFIEDASLMEQDFDSAGKRLMLAGFDVCVECQTASQGSLAGHAEGAVPLVHRAAFSAARHRGSFGLLVSGRQSAPHPAPFCFCWPGILLGLGLAWNGTVHQDYLHARLPELLNRHVFRDPEQVLGYLTVELGRLEDFLHGAVSTGGSVDHSSSVLKQMTVDPDAVSLDRFTPDLLQQVIRHVKKFEAELAKSRPNCDQHVHYVLEIRQVMDMLLFACRLGKALVSTGVNPSEHSCGLPVINVGISNLPSITRTDLANRLLSVRERYRSVWLGRNLPRGLEASLSVFDSLLRRLVPEGTLLPSDEDEHAP